MTQILIDCGLLERIGAIKSHGRICPQQMPGLELEEIDACSEDQYPIPVPDASIYVSVEL